MFIILTLLEEDQPIRVNIECLCTYRFDGDNTVVKILGEKLIVKETVAQIDKILEFTVQREQ